MIGPGTSLTKLSMPQPCRYNIDYITVQVTNVLNKVERAKKGVSGTLETDFSDNKEFTAGKRDSEIGMILKMAQRIIHRYSIDTVAEAPWVFYLLRQKKQWINGSKPGTHLKNRHKRWKDKILKQRALHHAWLIHRMWPGFLQVYFTCYWR